MLRNIQYSFLRILFSFLYHRHDFYRTVLYIYEYHDGSLIRRNELPTLREYLVSPPVFGEVRVVVLLNFLCCVVFCVSLRPVSCVTNVDSVSGLSIIDCPFGFFLRLQILHRISLQYPPNANERKTQTKRTKNERTLHTNDTKNTRCTKWIHDTNVRCTKERTKWTERTMRKRKRTNAQYTKRRHDTRTNESLERNHILSNDKRSWFYRSTI